MSTGVAGVDGEPVVDVCAVSDGDTGELGAVRGEAGAGSASDLEGFPRSFKPIFGTSRGVGVQYYGAYTSQLRSKKHTKQDAHQGMPL